MSLEKQYNNIAKEFSAVHDIGENSNQENRLAFYRHTRFLRPGLRVLDLGCGDGLDLAYYKSLGADIFGIDASEELIKIARGRLPGDDIRVGVFENLPYTDQFFDVVLSKYALQTSPVLEPCFTEVNRVLKPGGTLVYLVTHPFRQFFEKKSCKTDYFEQSVVDSQILNNSMTVKEPSHTLNEYLNTWLFANFDVQGYEECWDAAAEQIGERKYPGYFILRAIKRKNTPFKLAVISSASSDVSPEHKILAQEIGEYLAEKNITVVTGGSDGIPGLIIKSAFEKGAETVVYSPDTDELSHHQRSDNLSLSYFKKHHFIPGFTARSLKMINDVDGVLVLNGRIGTLSEFSIALEEGRNTAVIKNTGGVSSHLEHIVEIANKEFPNKIIFETDYKKAVDALVAQRN